MTQQDRFKRVDALFRAAINLDPDLADVGKNPQVLYNPHLLRVLLTRYQRQADALELTLDGPGSNVAAH